MTPRERVLAAVKGLPVDRVPVMYWLNPHMACRLLAEYRPGGDRMANALARMLWRRYVRGGGLNAGELTRAMPLLFEQYGNGPYALELGADLAIQSPDLTSAGSFLSGVRRRGGRLRIRGPLGITYGIGGIYAEVVDHPIEGPEDLRTFALPPVTAEQFAGIARFRRAHPDVCILAETFAFQQAVADFFMGTTSFMLALYDYPEALQAFMARLADWVIAIMRQTVRAGADIVFLQDDYGAAGGTLISMAMWEAFTFPHLKRMVEAVHDAGALFMLHSCGHQMPFLPYYVEAGVDILQSFQPKADKRLCPRLRAVRRPAGLCHGDRHPAR